MDNGQFWNPSSTDIHFKSNVKNEKMLRNFERSIKIWNTYGRFGIYDESSEKRI